MVGGSAQTGTSTKYDTAFLFTITVCSSHLNWVGHLNFKVHKKKYFDDSDYCTKIILRQPLIKIDKIDKIVIIDVI